MSLAANDCAERVEQLIVLTTRLTGMMTFESEAFEQHRPRDAIAGAEETARLANLYRHESMKIRRDPNLVSAAPLALRRRLIDATRAFDAALARHATAVTAAKIVTEGLVRAIAEEVVSQRTSNAGYGQGGQAHSGKATALTLNRQA